VRALSASPRRRRRLAWAAGGVALACGAGLAAALLPAAGGRGAVGAPPPRAAATVYPSAAERSVPLPAGDRRAIDALLDRFVPEALARRDPGAAYSLATPALRAGTTRAQWAGGALPVYPFAPRGTTYHDWTLDASYAGRASLDLLLQPRRGSRSGAIAFTFRLRKLGGRWLVDSVVPAAVFAPPGQPPSIRANPDFAAPALRPAGASGRLGGLWLAIPLGAVALLALVPVAVLLVGWLREERPFRRERLELPPLPARLRRPEA